MAGNVRFAFEPFGFGPAAAETELDRLIAGLDEGEQEGEVKGSCPDVVVPPAKRPRVLLRGSVHSAVREIQRKLNGFHAYRLAAGQPGLRDAPLVEDCIFGQHTEAAVRSFQELAFPGQPVEHDGKVGPHTWAQLDAIVLGPGGVAQLTVESLRVTDDSTSVALGWNQVIGLDTTNLNIEITASGLPPATMPPQIGVTLSSRAPNGAGGTATLAAAARFDVPRLRADPANPNRIVYRLGLALNSVGAFLKVERTIKEVATIVRNGGTSDVEFRRALGWNVRGIATQPTASGTATGSESGEVPDAFALFRAAGVEVLEVRVPAQPNWRIPAAVKRLIRNPADVVYYSGHGLSSSGKLALDIENKPCGEHGTYVDWLGPGDLSPVWVSPIDLDVLILAGCSVLKIDFSTSPPSGPGVAWSRLLMGKGGPLAALLGYQKGAPCDSPNGERIAKEMGQRLARGSTSFARDWLTANGDHNANNAVAMDSRGYWWIEGTLFGGYDIKGPEPIP
jgi:peptidoglycan hydrolase-like protein with peptidoglycan-binding domain